MFLTSPRCPPRESPHGLPQEGAKLHFELVETRTELESLEKALEIDGDHLELKRIVGKGASGVVWEADSMVRRAPALMASSVPFFFCCARVGWHVGRRALPELRLPLHLSAGVGPPRGGETTKDGGVILAGKY